MLYELGKVDLGVPAIAFTPDSRYVAFSAKGGVEFWRTADGTLARRVDLRDTATTLALSEDGHWAAAGTYQGEMFVWPLAGGEPRTIGGYERAIRSLAFSPDGRTLAAGTGDDGGPALVELWGVRDGAVLRALALPSHVQSLAFSPDGSLLASGLADGTIRVWGVVR